MTPTVCILVWKNLLVRKHQFIFTTLELLNAIGTIIFLNIIIRMTDSMNKFFGSLSNLNRLLVFESKLDKECEPESDDHDYSWKTNIYEPSNPFVDNLIKDIACQLNLKLSYFKPGILGKNKSANMQIKFEGMEKDQSSTPASLKYILYPSSMDFVKADRLWQDTEGTVDFEWDDLNRYFLDFKHAIDISFLKMKGINVTTLLTRSIQVVDFSGNFSYIFVITLLLTIYFLSNIIVTSRLVQEKVSGAKELLLMMGVKKWQIWLSDFIDAMMPLSIIISFVILLLHVSITNRKPDFQLVTPFDSIMVLLVGTISIIVFTFFLSCLFTSVAIALLVISALYVILSFAYVVLQKLSLSKFVALLTCVIPHIAWMEAMNRLFNFEFMEKKVNYNENISSRSEALTLLEILIMMMFDIILYSLLTWYLERVSPGPYGVPLSPIFFLKKSYWITKRVDDTNLDAEKDMEFFEEPRGLSIGISIQNVSKTYKTFGNGVIKAVDNVSIDFYENEITGLLGHNGAGKTTLISIICGLTPATSGRILVDGFNVTKNSSQARKSLGLCPQQDLLFGSLTALENIALYGMLKGLSKAEAYENGQNILKRFRMINVKNTQASNLSGGQKRKVSLATALAGDSKVIVLDEPTSGLDPEIRRDIWDLLMSLRGSKTVILTTHFMEEADALCNRIAIMDQGKIKCFATPMALKMKYGTGYTLSVVVADLGKVSKIIESVKGSIKTSTFKSQNALTLYFTMPESEIPNFPALFDNLDNKKTSREILTYSLTISTLEDVFLKVSQNASKKNVIDTMNASSHRSTDELQANKYSRRLIIFFEILALLSKKVIFMKKKCKAFIIFTVVMIAFVAIQQYAMKALSNETEITLKNSTITFSLDLYHKSDVFLVSDGANKLVTVFENLITEYGSKIKKVENVTKVYRALFYEDYVKYLNLLIAADFSENITIHYNPGAIHMLPIGMNLISNTYLEGSGKIESAIGFQYLTEDRDYILTPLPAQCPLDGIMTWPTIVALFFLIPLLEEQSHGAKHLQLMITSVIVYWLTHLIFDLIILLIILAVFFVVYGFFNKNLFSLMQDKSRLIVSSFILWSITLLLLNYVLTTQFKSFKGAFSAALGLFVIAYYSKLVALLMGKALNIVSYLHPTILADWNHEDICKNNAGPYYLGLGIYAAVMFVFLILVDSKILGTLLHKTMTNYCCKVEYHFEYRKDTAVEKEEENVRNLISEEELPSKALVVENLRRWYCSGCTQLAAVRGVSFSVNHGECFGLLGVNGAGKTSTFNILTGVLVPSSGKAYVESMPLFNIFKRSEAYSKIGYCPQSGGFIPCFSVTENLKFFAKLRGTRCSLVNKEVKKWIEKMNLEDHKKKRCLQLSGGNQRKLAAAICLIGDSPLIFLDEPTTGVDPSGRRSIWNLISEIREKGQSVVLTSHSMEECEALCTRLTIMVKGQLCCIGETTVLKEKFGQGFSVLIKIAVDSTDEEREKLKNEMVVQFDPGCNLTDEHLTMFQYHITNTRITWKTLFGKLSDIKKKFKFLESYSASSTTLEQLFLYFARI